MYVSFLTVGLWFVQSVSASCTEQDVSSKEFCQNLSALQSVPINSTTGYSTLLDDKPKLHLKQTVKRSANHSAPVHVNCKFTL